MTEWRTIADAPAYQVSADGQVRSFLNNKYGIGQTSKLLKPWLNSNGYPVLNLRVDGVSRRVLVHRLVGRAFHGLVDELEIDHQFHTPTDATQLRVATRGQNCANSRGWKKRSSRYKGVSWSAAKRKWYACIQRDGRTRSLGRYVEEADAARAYDRAALAAWGAFAFLNFPEAHA